jgi:hypothetical protein
MSDERADLMLNMLRAIRGTLDEHGRKLDEVITRLGALERDFGWYARAIGQCQLSARPH